LIKIIVPGGSGHLRGVNEWTHPEK